MRLLVVRHYRTLNNASRRIMGWGDAPPVPDWEDDLQTVADRLAAAGIRFDAYYSSALERARKTAEYFAGRFPPAPLISHPDLNEVHYGELFGLTKQTVCAAFPRYKTDVDYVFPGGESFRQMQQRSTARIQALESEFAGRTLLLVVHAGVIRALVSHFLGLAFEPHLKRRVSHRYIGDFLIEGGQCRRYDELGRPSGFVKDGVIELPWTLRPFSGTGTEALAARPR